MPNTETKVAITRDFLKEFGEAKDFKVFTKVTGSNKKSAYVYRKRVSLQDYNESYGPAKIYTPEEITKRNLGKIKCIAKFKTDDELKSILTKYFAA